jgi:hypothetical protein
MPELPEGYQRLEGSERRAAAGASLVGPADKAEALTVTITLRRMPGAPELPDEQYRAGLHHAGAHRRRGQRCDEQPRRPWRP